MKSHSNDPRARRTRQRLLEGFMQSVAEKPFRDVTISDITKRAEVNRATFYLHYEDKYDLLKDCANTLLDGIRDAIQIEVGLDGKVIEHPDNEPFENHCARMRIVLEHFQEHHEFFLAILGKDGDPLFQQLFRDGAATWIKSTLRTLLNHHNLPVDEDYIEMMVRFQSAGNFDVVMWWLEQDEPTSIDIMAQRLAHITLPPLMRLLQDESDFSLPKTPN